MMTVSPVLGFWHPPPPPQFIPDCTNGGVGRFVALINNNWTDSTHPYVFQEPADGYCDNFNVTVWIFNVTDLYGYEFSLYWDTTYLSLVSFKVEQLWPAGQQFQVRPDLLYAKTSPYVQVVGANWPAVGLNGTFMLATLIFHIDNDVCWPNDYTPNQWFQFYPIPKASDSCSTSIRLCAPIDGYWKFKPVQPEVYITPVDKVNSKLPDQYTATVWIKDIVKMKDFHLNITWDPYTHPAPDPCGYNTYYTVLLTTTVTDVVINAEVFPVANRTISNIAVVSPACGWYSPQGPVPRGSVRVDVEMQTGFPQINATNPSKSIWLFNVTFTKCDPWYCGAQPKYTAKTNHDWGVENASTPIKFEHFSWNTDLGYQGYVSMCCGNLFVGTTPEIKHTDAKYTFAPIPGDLDASGHTDASDLLIEAAYYGLPGYGKAGSCDSANIPYPGLPMGFPGYYDLNRDGYIDIFDLVIVAKNICRRSTSPYP